jgi:hypothetical protein
MAWSVGCPSTRPRADTQLSCHKGADVQLFTALDNSRIHSPRLISPYTPVRRGLCRESHDSYCSSKRRMPDTPPSAADLPSKSASGSSYT